jgi:PPOX class probable F420-dependent enzyme
MDTILGFEEFIGRARVARLATVNSQCLPYLVPVVFVFHENHFFIPLDEKKKKVKPQMLKRVLNIYNNPNVALLIDEYDEDWTKLAFVMIHGKASIRNKKQESMQLIKVYDKLHAKYPQYRKINPGEMFIVIKPEKVTSWTNY